MSLNTIPADRRDDAHRALVSLAGGQADYSVRPVVGGASGALTYRVEAGGGVYLMRMGAVGRRLRNPNEFRCMQMAASIGVAPPVRYIDHAREIAIMDFIEHRSLAVYPGGPHALVAAAGDLIGQLQAGTSFPTLAPYRTILGGLLAHLRRSNQLAADLLGEATDRFETIAAAYPWEACVASHNDPNPRNILFDGKRLWLIDWETAYLNDPVVDIAIITHELAPTPELEEVLLRSWHRTEPGDDVRARLTLMKVLTRLYYAVLTLSLTSSPSSSAPSGQAPLQDTQPEASRASDPALERFEKLRAIGNMMLAIALQKARTPEFARAVDHFSGGHRP